MDNVYNSLVTEFEKCPLHRRNDGKKKQVIIDAISSQDQQKNPIVP